MLLISIVPLVGCILLTVLPTDAGWGMIVASWLASVISSQFSILMSLSASNVRGNTKKAFVNAGMRFHIMFTELWANFVLCV